MGQIVSSAAKPKRCNLNQLSQVPTPAAGEHILVSSDNMFCANVVGIDTTNKLIKLVRVGLKSDNWLRPINVLTFDYANKKVITNY